MSRFDDLIELLEDEVDDATVSFEGGKRAIHAQGQARRVIFVRGSGEVQPKASPGRVRLGTPVSGVATYALQVFTRRESIEVTLRAADESALDSLFDVFLHAVFVVCGPNAFPASYSWFGDDSKDGGGWDTCQPAIKLELKIDLRSLPRVTGQSVEIDATEADAALLPPTGATAGAGATVQLDQP
jgi:hypothetical protein